MSTCSSLVLVRKMNVQKTSRQFEENCLEKSPDHHNWLGCDHRDVAIHEQQRVHSNEPESV